MGKEDDIAALRKLGNVIRELRKKKGLSQEQLGFLSGLDRSYVGGIERGERNLSFSNLLRVSDALGVSLLVVFQDFDKERQK